VWSPTTGVSGNVGSGWTFNPPTTTTYTLTASETGGANCARALSFTVNVDVFNVTALASDDTVCQLQPIILTATVTALAAGPAVLPGTYCAADSSTGAGIDPISSVTFNTLVDSSVQTAPWSTTYPASGNTTTTVTAGQTYSFALTNSGANTIASVWIDYDRDGLLEASEWTQLWTSATSGPVNITIPANAAGV
jgi:hypothetical protein